MDKHSASIQKLLGAVIVLALLAAVLFPGSSFALQPQPASSPTGQARLITPANPDLLPAQLPVYRIQDKVVNSSTALGLAGIFNGLDVTEVISETSHTGLPFYLIHNSRSGAVLEQYGGSGGFFAFNAGQAFQEVPAPLDYGDTTICDFLISKKLFPADTMPETRNCRGQNLNYQSSPIYQSTLESASKTPGFDVLRDEVVSSTQVIGQLWQVPLAVEVGRDVDPNLGPLYVPMGGPGGHLSLLLTGYDNRPSLDSSLPGLQALALPSFGMDRILIGLYPLVQPAAARGGLEAHLRSALPGAALDLGEPELIYYVEDPAVDQEAVMPVWYFPNATALVGGEEMNLRGITVPAVEGFLPTVEISSPASGAPGFPGKAVDLTAAISGGEPPYTYTLELEDATVLKSGVLAGSVLEVNSGPLPDDPRPEEAGIFLVLNVIDSNGAAAADSVIINVASNKLFAPLVSKVAGPQLLSLQTLMPEEATAIRKMGAEWVRYYNGHGTNLPGTVPDATGFYSGLTALGWSGQFSWNNNNAWERDWRDCSLGGLDCTSGVDRAELIYFAGHGSPARINFGVEQNSYIATAENARFQNVRWAGFATCQTLRAGPYVSPGNPPLTKWFNSFQGSYMLFGFHSNMNDVAFGPRFVNNARNYFFFQRTLREAWVLTAFEMNAGKPAYLYAHSSSFSPADLKLPGSGASLPPLLPGTITGFSWVWWE